MSYHFAFFISFALPLEYLSLHLSFSVFVGLRTRFYEGRHEVKFLTDMHEDNFCVSFLFLAAAADEDIFLAILFLPLKHVAIFLTAKRKLLNHTARLQFMQIPTSQIVLSVIVRRIVIRVAVMICVQIRKHSGATHLIVLEGGDCQIRAKFSRSTDRPSESSWQR